MNHDGSKGSREPESAPDLNVFVMRTFMKKISLGLALSCAVAACSSLPSAQDEAQSAGAALGPSDTASARAMPLGSAAKRSNDKKTKAVSQASASSSTEAPADLVVLFSPGDARLSDDAVPRIAALAEQLKSNRDQDAELTAKSDYMGSRSLCLALAANRLNALVSKLLQLGVHIDQLRQQNMGCENVKMASATCQTGQCLAPNERIEIRLTR